MIRRLSATAYFMLCCPLAGSLSRVSIPDFESSTMFTSSNLTIRFLVGAVVAALLFLLGTGGGTTSTSAETGRMAAEAGESAVDLSQQAETLKREVDAFIVSVRAS